jgi:pyrroloquinoline quinone (PQQ) biosynthesis protein C
MDNLESILLKCWSIKTSSKWTSQNPYKGQCGLTALVVYELFGGQILKTRINNQWHYYNFINAKRYDFTKKQFDFEPFYSDILSNCEEAFTDTNEEQYTELKSKLFQLMNGQVEK